MALMIKRENDWCFICQKRRNKLVGINYDSKNDNEKPEVKFIRICIDCLKRSLRMAEDNKLPINTTIDNEEKG